MVESVGADPAWCKASGDQGCGFLVLAQHYSTRSPAVLRRAPYARDIASIPSIEAQHAHQAIRFQSTLVSAVSSLLDMAVPWWMFVLRAVVVYAFLLLLLRITGKRQVGQLAPFDLVLLLVLSNAVQNSMNAGDNSLVGGLISATALVALNYSVGFLTFRSRRIERLVDGQPEVLIRDGQLFKAVMRRAQLTEQELQAALRQAGCAEVEEVSLAILEVNGAISVIQQRDKPA